ncbi:MAG: thioredoxin [Micavibrio sp.]|nr:MAG: thioredoxin [Micavibrio sp.]
MPFKRLTVFFTLLFTLGLASPAFAKDGGSEVYMLVFYSDGCSHCIAQKPFLKALDTENRNLIVNSYDLQQRPEHIEAFQEVAANHGVPANSVPSVFVGGRAWVGDSNLIRDQIAAHVKHCIQSGTCPDSRDNVLDSSADLPPASASLNLPFIGSLDLNVQPIVLSTALIAFIDGFNPCSLWVLTILLALVIHSGSRQRILVVGLTFLTVTATIYGLFIVGVFGAMNLMAMTGWLYPVVALFALIFAVVNIKDYFYFQKGISFTIDAKHKPGIYKRIRGLMAETNSMPALIGATTLMAGGIAFIELPCTAGFPVIWTGIVASQDIGLAYFAVLLALYLLIYLGIELVIFFIALRTLRIDRFQDHHGRILKLIGGIIMLALAGVLVFAPDLMHNFTGALGVFLAASMVTLLVLFLHRYLLPKMGVYLGDEFSKKQK